jgi:L-asparaginase/Glu-tRNA(Gln) amidotransferase subunit D
MTLARRRSRPPPPGARQARLHARAVAVAAASRPRVLILHTGGTLGMAASESFVAAPVGRHPELVPGTGGTYPRVGPGGLQPGALLTTLLARVPEMRDVAVGGLKLEVPFNLDSSRVGPPEWVILARALDAARASHDAFLIIHGTDTLAYTAAALSYALAGFGKPIVLTGSQLPLAAVRSDARPNLIDALTCAVAGCPAAGGRLKEVAVCFGGVLLRGNRAQKVNSSSYAAFGSPSFGPLARLGVDVDWKHARLLEPVGDYRPRFSFDPAVAHIPVTPGADPRMLYGDMAARGVRGVVVSAYGVGNMPDADRDGWLDFIGALTSAGVRVLISSQCAAGDLRPDLYRSGAGALAAGAATTPGSRMTAEAAVVKMMFCLATPGVALGESLAGEL